jgi:hypothetical protein
MKRRIYEVHGGGRKSEVRGVAEFGEKYAFCRIFFPRNGTESTMSQHPGNGIPFNAANPCCPTTARRRHNSIQMSVELLR